MSLINLRRTVGNTIRAILHSVNLDIPHFTLCNEALFTNPQWVK